MNWSDDKEAIKELLQDATGKIKMKTLTEMDRRVGKRLYDQPLVDHLEKEEQPEFVLTHDTKGFRITHPDGTEETPDHSSETGHKYLFITDQRILYVVGYEDGDKVMEFGYDEIVSVDTNKGLTKGRFTFEDIDGTKYKFVTPHYAGQVNDAGEYVKDIILNTETKEPKSKGDIDDTVQVSPIELVKKDDHRSNTITIPTRSSGARFTSKGWSLGGAVRRSSAKGRVEEEPFEETFDKLIIHEDIIEIGIVTNVKRWTKESKERTMRIDISDVTDVRQEDGLKFIFETAEDLFEFSFSNNNSNQNLVSKATIYLEKRINEKTDYDGKSDEETRRGEDRISQLERLSELHEKGVLSDEEFESKKSELLDDI